MTLQPFDKKAWGVFAGILLLALLVLLISPQEQTLGKGIRSVYVHVGLIWAGITGLGMAGLLGLALLVTDRHKVRLWMDRLGWLGFGFYTAGFFISGWAQIVNWGGIAWFEPRLASGLTMMAMAVILLVLSNWLPWGRLAGLLTFAVIPLLVWSTTSADLILHPRDPIGSSSATGIRLTFLLLYLLSLAAGGWLLWQWHRWRQPAAD